VTFRLSGYTLRKLDDAANKVSQRRRALPAKGSA
jgi:hypothetical protein